MSRTKDRKVAKAASIGGGVTSRGKTSTGWYLILALVVAGGVALIWVSLAPRHSPSTQDHWHTALGLYVCDKFAPNLPQPQTLLGLHTHGDGLVHIEPLSDADPTKSIGKRATLGRFMQGHPDFKVSKTSLQVPGELPKKNGDLCGDKPGKVKISIWETRTDKTPTNYTGDPKLIRIRDGQLVTIGFVPEGTELPKPASEQNLLNPNAAEGTGGQPGGAPGQPGAPGGLPPGGSTPDISVGIQAPATAPQDPAAPAPAP